MPKFILFVGFLVALSSHSVLGGINDTINKIIEEIRQEIPEKITIPKLDIIIPENNDILSGSVNVTNVEITGIKEFIAKLAFGLLIPKSFTIEIDNIKVLLDYSSDVALYKIPFLSIFGNGTVDLALGFVLQGDLNIGLAPIQIHVVNVSLTIKEENSKLNITGLLGDEEVSEMVDTLFNDNFAKIINDNNDAISPLLTSAINDIIDSISNKNKTHVQDISQNIKSQNVDEETSGSEGFILFLQDIHDYIRG